MTVFKGFEYISISRIRLHQESNRRGTFHLFVLFPKPLIPHSIHHISNTLRDSYNRGSRDTANSLSGWQGSQFVLLLPTIPKCTITSSIHPTKI